MRNMLTLPLIIAFSLSAGCAHIGNNAFECGDITPSTRVLGVVPLYQTVYDAGPAALTMVLNYHGVGATLEQTTAKLTTSRSLNVGIEDLMVQARRFFPSSRVKKSNLCDVTRSLSQGYPVILFIDLGKGMISTPRYLVAVGYEAKENMLIFHNGYAENVRAPFELITDKWEKAGSLALFID